MLKTLRELNWFSIVGFSLTLIFIWHVPITTVNSIMSASAFVEGSSIAATIASTGVALATIWLSRTKRLVPLGTFKLLLLISGSVGGALLEYVISAEVEDPFLIFAFTLLTGIAAAGVLSLWLSVFSISGSRMALAEIMISATIQMIFLTIIGNMPSMVQTILVIAAYLIGFWLLLRALNLTQDEQDQTDGLQNGSAPQGDQKALVLRYWLYTFLTGFLLGVIDSQFPNSILYSSLPNSQLQVVGSFIAIALVCLILKFSFSTSPQYTSVRVYQITFVIVVSTGLLGLLVVHESAYFIPLAYANYMIVKFGCMAIGISIAHALPHLRRRVILAGVGSCALGEIIVNACIFFTPLHLDSIVLSFIYLVIVIGTYTVVFTPEKLAALLALSRISAPFLSKQNIFNAEEEISEAIAHDFELTQREEEVLLLLIKGRTSRRIQEELFISDSTARTHIRHIYSKLDIHSKQEVLDLVDSYKKSSKASGEVR